MQKEHIQYPDGLRGFACLMVILSHADAFIGTMTSPNDGFSQGSLIYQWSRNIFDGNFAVCIFFVLSGYALICSFFKTQNPNPNYLSEAAIKRYFRLTPLVFTSVLLAYLLWKFGWYFNKEAAELMGGTSTLKEFR